MGPSPSLPTVQLLHELADGTSHVDWMIAQDPRGERPLVTFRLAGRVDSLGGGTRMDAHRLGDHRPAYLAYEGAVSGNRGNVRRLARGRVVRWEQLPGSWQMEVAWDLPDGPARRQRLLLERLGDGAAWRIAALSDP